MILFLDNWARIKCSLSSSDVFSQGKGHDEVESAARQSLEKRYDSLVIV
jgi:hypothetical protein